MLTVTEMLRKEKVVGKFVEFFGEGAASLAVPDRATIGNMAPEYGATMGFFPVDDATVDYLRDTGRTDAEIDAFEAYFRAQEHVRHADAPARSTTREMVELDLVDRQAVARRPEAPAGSHRARQAEEQVHALFSKPAENGFSKPRLARSHIALATAQRDSDDQQAIRATSRW